MVFADPTRREGGGVVEGMHCAAAPVFSVWFVDYCEICGEPQVFLVGALGLAASCVNCKDQRIAPFTRVSSEVA